MVFYYGSETQKFEFLFPKKCKPQNYPKHPSSSLIYLIMYISIATWMTSWSLERILLPTHSWKKIPFTFMAWKMRKRVRWRWLESFFLLNAPAKRLKSLSEASENSIYSSTDDDDSIGWKQRENLYTYIKRGLESHLMLP